VSFWASIPVYFVSDADAFRVINNERGVFGKDAERVSDVKMFGNATLLTKWKARGAQYLWKKYRLDNGERVEKA
jgi:hypothetical protein